MQIILLYFINYKIYYIFSIRYLIIKRNIIFSENSPISPDVVDAASPRLDTSLNETLPIWLQKVIL